ncbi:MAG: 2-phospho-L-lactate guanylyltransferase [Chloroflexota bacterium]
MTTPGDAGPTVAITPVKDLGAAKSRLADCLSSVDRAELVLRLLDRVLAVVRASTVVQYHVVVSPDPIVRARAAAAGAVAIADPAEGSGQNVALEHARSVTGRWRPGALLVLSGDLPLVTASDLEEICCLGLAEGSVVLAPDRHGIGTNVLYLRPPDLLPFRFGVDSFQRHAGDAAARGLRTLVYRGPGTAYDLDRPDDLDLIQRVDSTFRVVDLQV